MWKFLSAALGIVVLAGCGQSSKEITETRVIEKPAPAAAQNAPAPLLDPALLAPQTSETAPYQWKLPEGWSEAAPTPMRIGNFTIEAHPEIECYMTVLQGAAGGVEANLNRWRGQMGQPELDAAAIAALPKVEMLATPSPLIEISGSYTTMTGKLYEHYMMMAVVCALPDKTLFVKMTGPEADVQAQKENFAAFCKSIKEGEAPIDAGSKENQ